MRSRQRPLQGWRDRCQEHGVKFSAHVLMLHSPLAVAAAHHPGACDSPPSGTPHAGRFSRRGCAAGGPTACAGRGAVLRSAGADGAPLADTSSSPSWLLHGADSAFAPRLSPGGSHMPEPGARVGATSERGRRLQALWLLFFFSTLRRASSVSPSGCASSSWARVVRN